MTCCFIMLRYFLSILSILWIFCSESAKYHRYLAHFITFIKVFPNSVLLSKSSFNTFRISSVNEEKGSYKSMVLLNIRLVKFWIINNLYCNYLASNISTKTIRNKNKVIYNKYTPIIIKDAAINNKNKRIGIE